MYDQNYNSPSLYDKEVNKVSRRYTIFLFFFSFLNPRRHCEHTMCAATKGANSPRVSDVTCITKDAARD